MPNRCAVCAPRHHRRSRPPPCTAVLRSGHVGHHRGGFDASSRAPASAASAAPGRRRRAGQCDRRRVAVLQSFIRLRTSSRAPADPRCRSAAAAAPGELVAQRATGAGRRFTGTIAATRRRRPAHRARRVAADRAGGARQQHVVDRAAERLAHRLTSASGSGSFQATTFERTGALSWSAVGFHQRSAVASRATCAHPRRSPPLGGGVRVADCHARGGEHAARQIAGGIDRLDRRLGDRCSHSSTRPAPGARRAAAAAPARRRPCRRRCWSCPSPVPSGRCRRLCSGGCARSARDRGRSSDQVELPQRPLRIERLAGQLRNSFCSSRVPPCGQAMRTR